MPFFHVDTQTYDLIKFFLSTTSYLGVKIVLQVVVLRTGLVLMAMAVAAVVVAVIISNKEIKDGTNRAIPKHLLLVLELMQMVSGINITNSIMANNKVVVTNDQMSRQTPFISLIL